ncbi:hypothetical protein J3F84DRAFT_398331 [Trichoderma pleuroticola]
MLLLRAANKTPDSEHGSFDIDPEQFPASSTASSQLKRRLLKLALILSGVQSASNAPFRVSRMPSHKHNPSPVRSAVKNQNQCHSSVTPSSAAQSSPTGLIPSWLLHVQASGMSNETSREILRQASPGPGETLWHPNGIPTVHIQSNYDAGRYQASDVFIQDTPSPPSLAGQTSRPLVHDPYLNDDHDKDVRERKGHSHPRTHVSTPSGPSRAKYGIFEKQPRRKTRKDRYDTVKLKGARTGKQQAKKSSTRVSKIGRLRSSREIMANFTSSAIAHPNERITLKARFKPGLFVNGRSSVPLTDLVFNDIPSPDQGRTPTDKEPWETPRERQSEGQEDGPPLESPDTRDRRATSTTSSSYFRPIRRPVSTDTINGEAVAGRANTIVCDRDDDSSGAKDCAGNNNRPPPQPDSFTLHIRPIYSLSPSTDPYISDLNTLNMPFSSNGHSIQEAQRESAARHQERNDGGNGDSNQVKATKYRDIGVMSQEMHATSTYQRSPPALTMLVSYPGRLAKTQIPHTRIRCM